MIKRAPLPCIDKVLTELPVKGAKVTKRCSGDEDVACKEDLVTIKFNYVFLPSLALIS